MLSYELFWVLFDFHRDPNLQKTIDTFTAAAKWAAEGSFTQQDIDEAKLSVFAQVRIIAFLS
jgi:presequence protease